VRLPGSAAGGEFFPALLGSALCWRLLGIGIAAESKGARRCWPAEIGRNIDPVPAGQDDVPGNDAQIPFLAALTLDHICGADREPPRQAAGQTIGWQPHDTLSLRNLERNALRFGQVPQFYDRAAKYLWNAVDRCGQDRR